MTEQQTRVALARFPNGVPTVDDFELTTGPVPIANDGEILVRNHYLSLDPFLRGVISGRQIYAQKIEPGDTMPGNTVAEVIASDDARFTAGDIVVVDGGWQQFAAVSADSARKVDSAPDLRSLRVGVLGMSGLTAYAGLLRLGEPVAGDTVVVSAASGPVGSMVGQIARIKGCRVIGIAGSPEKCSLVVDEFGFDACINYKTEDLTTRLAELCPDGINVYFDNVGGDTLAAVLTRLALGARIILCGLITQYNSKETPPGPNLGPVIGARATMRGLVVYDHYDLWDTFSEEAGAWIRSGDIRYLESRSEGLAEAASAFSRLMRGENFGKELVVIESPA
ncbi:MAG: NADP-dependent oxidoreductase [Pseudomonadota bacterium]